MDKEELEFRVNQVIYKKVFEYEECEKLLEYYQDGMSPSGTLTYTSNDRYRVSEDLNRSDYRRSNEKFISQEEGAWIKEKLKPTIKDINDKFFKIESLLFGQFGFLEYKENDEFKWHTDMGLIAPYSLRKISIVIFMSNRDEYEGGQIEFLPKLKDPIKMEKGYMLVFPSHKIHRVSPITKGIRRTLVSWLYEYNPTLDVSKI